MEQRLAQPRHAYWLLPCFMIFVFLAQLSGLEERWPAGAVSGYELFVSSGFRWLMGVVFTAVALALWVWILVLRLRGADMSVVKRNAPLVYGLLTVPAVVFLASTLLAVLGWISV